MSVSSSITWRRKPLQLVAFGLGQRLWISASSVGLPSLLGPVPQRRIADPERAGDLSDRPARATHQLERESPPGPRHLDHLIDTLEAIGDPP